VKTKRWNIYKTEYGKSGKRYKRRAYDKTEQNQEGFVTRTSIYYHN
jgi:hypothetical protein